MSIYMVKIPFSGILTTAVSAGNEQEAIEWAMRYQDYGSMKVLDFDKDNIKVDLVKKAYEGKE